MTLGFDSMVVGGPRGHSHWQLLRGGDSLHGASNSKSFSSKRMVGLCCVGEGTSRLRRRVQSFAAFLDREPVLVTMILPHSTSWGARRSSGGDIRVSAICGIAVMLGLLRPLLLSLAMSR